jgi:hypothetical protein
MTQPLYCDTEGKKLRTERDATDLISEALCQSASLVVIPVERLHEDFFRLKTRVAGEFLQKFVNYRRRVAILGDISRYVEESDALRDFVYECNRGDHIWFVMSVEELEQKFS